MNFRDPSSIQLPTTDDDFERLCLLIARDRYGPEFYRYGRKGQAQYGIDIYSAYHAGICIQCKLHKKFISDKELIDELNNDFQAAKIKFTYLKQFIFAVSVETRPKLQDFCNDISNANIHVIPWFWNQLQEDIACSKWLLRYCLNYEVGAQWVHDEFLVQELKKGEDAKWQPLQYYSNNSHVQWYGLLKEWDAPRIHYRNIYSTIADSFADKFSNISVAAIVRGDGGSGKSVLLRRLAVDLRNIYSVYWISDNSEDFLTNEWLYDIERNPNENFLLILEDWYRNFTRTNDRITANKLLQKIKNKPNIRLLIGDRPSRYTFYPKNDQIIFDLKSEENSSLLSYISSIIPTWKVNFTDEQKFALLRTGLFQILFVCQYLDTDKPSVKAEEYFIEIIQSDYRHLNDSENLFRKGLGHALYIYAHLYTDFGVRLSPEAFTSLAEIYSGSSAPAEIRQNVREIILDSIVKRYLDITEMGNYIRLRFLHDALADQGWKFVNVSDQLSFRGVYSIDQMIECLKTEKTAHDLSAFLYSLLQSNQNIISIPTFLACVDFLISVRCESVSYIRALFNEDLMEIEESERQTYLGKLFGIGNRNHVFWSPVVAWIKKRLNADHRKKYLVALVEAGNISDPVLAEYFRLLDETELLQKGIEFITTEKLNDPLFMNVIPVVLRLLSSNNEIRTTMKTYLKSTEPKRVFSNFTVCLNLLKGEKEAEQAARKYLQSNDPDRLFECFTTCLNILKEEVIAKEAARKYLSGYEPERIHQSFVTCLKILHDEKIAKDAAREYLAQQEAERDLDSYTACLQILGIEASDIAAHILGSPISAYNHKIIYRALHIAAKIERLDALAHDMVHRIIEDRPVNYDKSLHNQYYLYLQIMKVPLFRLGVWQSEVSRLLQNASTINRNIFYSLTISHTEKPEPLADACLFYIRNWEQEFRRPKKFWGYFKRSLAHPTIKEHLTVQEEIRTLCRQMLIADNCPRDLKDWLKSISDKNIFPDWKRYEDVLKGEDSNLRLHSDAPKGGA